MWHIIKTEFHYSNKNIALVLAFLIPGVLLYMRASPTTGMSAMLFPLIIMNVLVVVAVMLGIPLSQASIWENGGHILRVLCFLVGLVFLYPAIVVFERRRSYLE